MFNKLKLLRNYDLSFFYSNGSVPWLGAKKNLLHFQVPFQKVGGKGWLTRLKLKKIDAIVCNSFFTKRFIDREFGVDSRVVYPPVAVDQFSSGKKENLILSVGRFTDLLHNKRQDVLVAAFKKLINRTKLDYRLVLAGGAKEGKKLVRELTDKIQDYPIEIIPDLPFGELKKLYARARIFWTASGFGVDEEKNPESVEHFGITTAEAMAAGCVPIVIAKGGQKEIVDSGKDGFLWQQPSELIELTENIINRPTQLKIIARAAIKKARKFSYQQFCQEYEALIALSLIHI